MIVGLVYLLVIVGLLVFFVRAQRRRAAAHDALVSSVEVGDEIVTTAGIFGTVASIDDETLELAIAPGVLIRIARGAVMRIVEEPPAVPQAPDEEGQPE